MTTNATTVVRIYVQPPEWSPDMCMGDTHVFAEKVGRCKCGRESWDEPPSPRPDLRLVP